MSAVVLAAGCNLQWRRVKLLGKLEAEGVCEVVHIVSPFWIDFAPSWAPMDPINSIQ